MLSNYVTQVNELRYSSMKNGYLEDRNVVTMTWFMSEDIPNAQSFAITQVSTFIL